jgi:hypothetical protein
MESRTKGAMILRVKGRFYKVLKLKSTKDNNYSFECKDLDKRESKILQYTVSGLFGGWGLGFAPCFALLAVKLKKRPQVSFKQDS